jgi:hypothetical protein
MKVEIVLLLSLAASVMLSGSRGDQNSAREFHEAIETPVLVVAGSPCAANSHCDDGNSSTTSPARL